MRKSAPFASLPAFTTQNTLLNRNAGETQAHEDKHYNNKLEAAVEQKVSSKGNNDGQTSQ